MNNHTDWNTLLAEILAQHDCQTGTIHQINPDTTLLDLLCQIGVPDSLIATISHIPVGKGIAGAAAEKRQPVTLCNLQQDLGGIAKPDARKTGVSGSIAVPIFNSDRSQILGTLGIGKFQAHEFSDSEIRQIEAHAEAISRIFAATSP